MPQPVVNITNSPGLTNLDTANSTTGWAGFNDGSGGTPSVVNTTEVFIQSTASNSAKISGSNQNKGIWYDNTTGIDMTVTGRHLYIWALVSTAGLLNNISAGGIYIKVASDASGANWSKWFVSGKDRYPGGWVRFVMDLNKAPSESATTAATLTSVRWFGVGIKSTGSSTAENLFVDRIDYGDGLQIEDGNSVFPANWAWLYSVDNAAGNKYGIIERKSGVYFLKGGVTIGDGSSTAVTLWDDQSAATVVFENPLYYNGNSEVSSIDAANLYKIKFEGNGTGTTDIDFGTVVGTGDDRQGVLGGSLGTAGPRFEIDGETDIADIDTLNLYGMQISRAGVCNFDNATKTDVIGCAFIGCDEVQPNAAEFLNNTIVAPTPDRGLEITNANTKQINFVAGSTADGPADRVWQVTAGGSFVEETVDFNDAGSNDCVPFAPSEAVSAYFAVGYRSRFAKLRIDTGTARVGGTLVWEYSTASGWTALSGVTDGTNTLSTTGLQDLTYTLPSDWVRKSLNGEAPAFYIRLRLTAASFSTDPLIDQGFIADVIEHAIHFPSTGTLTIEEYEFFGFGAVGAHKWMGENSSAGLVTANLSGGGNLVAGEVELTGGGSITVNNTVLVRITCKRADTLAVIESARVLLEADTGGDLPSGASVTITRVSTTATVSHTAHGMSNGQKVAIRGANQPEYNGIHSISNVSANAYDYTVSGSPTSPATGTITSTAVILDGTTNVSGVIEDSSFQFTSSQPVSGIARKGTVSPRFVTTIAAGSIESLVGFQQSVFMVSDE